MVDISADSKRLEAMSGTVLMSEGQPGVQYRLERCIGEGGMGVAFFALRQAPDGLAPVVIKVVRPEIVARANETAALLVQKEAVALGRLNERVPPTPFVVRFVDAGFSQIMGPRMPPLPWLAVEYVHGGVEGTALEDRMAYSIRTTGIAFGMERAAHLARCLASGLEAIHAVGVVHRDITPNNILCCGFGEAELFKVSDFGIARPRGLRATFGDMVVGTPGYMAPEQTMSNAPENGFIGSSDIFSFGCLLYFVLTGEPLFLARTPVAALLKIREPRRSIREGAHLDPALRKNDSACRAIDHALARATAEKPQDRFEDAREMAASIVPWLTQDTRPPRPARAILDSLMQISPPQDMSGWTWTVRYPPGDSRVVQSAAWDVDGHCFVMTTDGPAFWNGNAWVDRFETDAPLPAEMLFTRRYEAGGWLLGGRQGTLAVYATDGVREVLHCPDTQVTFHHASGRFDDLLVAVGEKRGSPLTLWALAAHRWMKPLPLPGVAYVSALLRLDDDRWLIAGRLEQGRGFAAIYSPMQWEITYLLAPQTRAFVGGASAPERGLGLVVGTDGVALRVEGEESVSAVVRGTPDLSAAAMDVLDREWVTSSGRLWVRDPAQNPDWRVVWEDHAWLPPFVSLMADAGMIIAMAVDGGIVEGRAGWKGAHPRPVVHSGVKPRVS